MDTTGILIAAAIAAVVVLLNKGTLWDAIKAFFNALVKPQPQPSPPASVDDDSIPPYEERLRAVLLLKKTFAHPTVDCAEALAATDVCMNHLLDDVKPHE